MTLGSKIRSFSSMTFARSHLCCAPDSHSVVSGLALEKVNPRQPRPVASERCDLGAPRGTSGLGARFRGARYFGVAARRRGDSSPGQFNQPHDDERPNLRVRAAAGIGAACSTSDGVQAGRVRRLVSGHKPEVTIAPPYVEMKIPSILDHELVVLDV